MKMKYMFFVATLATGTVCAQMQEAGQPVGSAATRLQATQEDPESLKLNMESVGKLLETSSAARQIDSSNVPEAVDGRQKARATYQAARDALAAGDLQKAAQLLTETRTLFFAAVRKAAPQEVTTKKQENDYKARLESVNALLGAYKRVASEKSAKGVGETTGQIEKGLAAAAKLAEAGNFLEGRAELDRVYLVAKASISGLRSGDTLVRSLNFANKEEEYHYEIDRNNTHQMLIEVLVAEKRADTMVQNYLAKAKDLRAQAEAAAKSKDYTTGVKLLEESTAELVRAIRGAGIYIPG
ncbi:MAG: hypothetical protein M0P39_03060 [Rhodocyclaceae bacterium]|nr:hypothetical protein [Rhodocyclaceae bacterium]